LELRFNSAAGVPRGGIDLLYKPPGAPALVPVPRSLLINDRSLPQRTRSADARVSVFNPASVFLPQTTSAEAVLSVFSPAPVFSPQTTAAADVLSVFNPASVFLPQTTAAVDVLSLASGPAVASVEPRQISRSGQMPVVLTIFGANLSNIASVGLNPASNIAIGTPQASPGGDTVTVGLTLDGSTPLGAVHVTASGPGFTTAVSAATNFEVVQ
jgi:hypothetical protein